MLLFLNMTANGAPVVRPSNTPLRISGSSASTRGVVPFAPLFRRRMSAIKSSTPSTMPGFTPSTTTPIAPPCDSPKISTLKLRPNVFMSKSDYHKQTTVRLKNIVLILSYLFRRKSNLLHSQ